MSKDEIMSKGHFKKRGNGKGKSGKKKEQSSKTKSTEKKKLEDHAHCVGNSKQASDCLTNTLFIINHIKRTCDRGAESRPAKKARQDDGE